MFTRLPILLALVALVPGTAHAQGDDCSSATAISGSIALVWNNSAATTSNFDGGAGLCFSPTGVSPPTNTQIESDLFYAWTATAAGAWTIDTLGSNPVINTKLSVHQGGDCSATCLDANDSVLSPLFTTSRVVLQGVTTGDTFLIQLGSWDSTTPVGAGNLTIAQVGPVALNDDCSTATAISGLGGFLFDNTLATTTAFNGGGPPCFGPAAAALDSIDRDVFFQWTALNAGDYVVDTVATGTIWDTKLNVHSGSGCSATCLVSNDDLAPLIPILGGQFVIGQALSKVRLFNVSIGDSFLIQTGSWGTQAQAGNGQLNVALDPCALFPDDGFEPNDTCATAAVLPTNIGFSTLLKKESPDVYTIPVPAGATLTVNLSYAASVGFLEVFLGPELACSDEPTDFTGAIDSQTTLDPEFLADNAVLGPWTNTTGAPQNISLRIVDWIGDPIDCVSVSIFASLTGVVPPPLVLCDPANPHVGGTYTKLNSTVIGTGVESGLRLESTDGPPGQFGFFLVSASAGATTPVFQGILCLSLPIGRYNGVAAASIDPTLQSLGQFDAAGVMQNISGTSSTGTGFDVPVLLPNLPAGSIQPGDTWFFQAWHRDLDGAGASSSNFSNVVQVSFP